ncbi:MAG: DNA polymerase III subunit gamma/tau [Bdellovibrionaceae bacterium]|nr:DNA polymerase III subunit gamma/tau [Pseudobdellovibrionaceae bacterium]
MSYQVIARKWRPKNFDQLVGQSHISTTLQNALKNGRLPHALLFTGPRGTGKTSSARILAKSLRCPNAVNFVPCNQCQICEDVSQGRSIDVIEIDGASNNGVDAIRELRDTVGYMPSSGKYKVYIIDEVHMLSTSAFNALLKTLEEPPEHVVFIMATTEVHKIPQTILSRCQRFDFRRISTRQITEQLKMICEADGVQAEEEALWVIARQGDGSMRDSQSLLDQVITFANGPLKRATVVEILGLTDHALLYATLSALAQREPTQILPILSKVALAGYEPSLFAQDLMENLRHLLFVKIGQDQAVRMVELPDSELRTLQEIAATLTEEEIHFLFDMAVKGAGDIMRSSEPRIVLEMVLLRMAAAPRLQDLASLLNGAASVHPGQVSVPKPPLSQAVRAAHPNTTQPAPGSRPASRAGLELSPQERWFEFVQKIRGLDAFLAAKLEPLIFTGVKDKTVELVIPPKAAFLKDQLMDAETQKKIKSLIDQHWAAGYAVNVQMGSGGTEGTSAQALAQDKAKKKEQDLAAQISEHPKVKTAAAVFKGQIKTIKESGSKNGGTSR